MIVRELVTRLGFSADSAPLKKYEQSLVSTTVAAKQLFAVFAASISLRALQHIGDETQSLEARISQLPQTIGEAGAAFDVVAQHASAARQDLKAYADVYTRIGNAAQDYVKSQDELLQITDTLSKALVVGGASAQEQASAFLQFSQGLGSGALQGDEFRAMAESAPQYMTELAKAIGVPRGELKKLGSEGKITTQQIIDATLKMTATFDKKFREMPMTIGQAFVIVQNKFAVMVAKLNRKSKAISTIANFIVDGFDKISDAIATVGSAIDTVVSKTIGWESALRLLTIFLSLTMVPRIIAGIRAITIAMQAMFLRLLANPVVATFSAIIAILALLIEDLWVFSKGGKSATGRLIQWLKEAKDGFQKMWEDFLVMISGWKDSIAQAGAYLADAFIRPWEERIGKIEEMIKEKLSGYLPKVGTGKSFGLFGKNTVFENNAAIATQVAAGSFFPGASKVQNTFSSNINITVPAGTSEYQQDFISKHTDQAIHDSFQRMISNAGANFPQAE